MAATAMEGRVQDSERRPSAAWGDLRPRMFGRPLVISTLLFAGLAAGPAARAATVTIAVDAHADAGDPDAPRPTTPARDGTRAWHVTLEHENVISGTVTADNGQPTRFSGQCDAFYRVVATGKVRRGQDCIVREDGTYTALVTVSQHARAWVVLKADPGNEEYPIAADTPSPEVVLRVQPALALEDIYTGGRLLDGRLVIRFVGYVNPPAAAGRSRVVLQRKAGRRFVNIGRTRLRGGPVLFERFAPTAGAYRFLWLSPDRRRWDDTPSAPRVYRR